MDVHRCRFVPYPSPGINALAFSHTPSQLRRLKRAPTTLRLALGRTNGDIEIWNPNKGNWFQERIFPGARNRSIEGLVWTQEPDEVTAQGGFVEGRLRLFSNGYSDAVTEWDLASGKPIHHASSHHGDIWCSAAQPKADAPPRPADMDADAHQDLCRQAQQQQIVLGCADGSIVLISTADNDLQFSRIIARPAKKRTRVLSLCFRDRHTIVAGYADSTIRVYDMRSLQQGRSMTVAGGGREDKPKEILVWSVRCLPDGTIISGDSNGTLTFWDASTLTLRQRLEGHEADILDLAVDETGSSIFSAGMDRRICLYRKVADRNKNNRWTKVTHSRPHRNDVKALASLQTKKLSVLISGGADTIPVVTPIRQFGREYHRALSHLPQSQPVYVASQARRLCSWWDNEVHIWSIPRSADGTDWSIGLADHDHGHQLLAKICLQDDEHITSVVLSPRGTLLAVSTIVGIKCFHLQRSPTGMKIRKLILSSDLSQLSSHILRLSPDGKWLAAAGLDQSVYVCHIVLDDSEDVALTTLVNATPRILKRKKVKPQSQQSQDQGLGNYDRHINCLEFGYDSNMLLAADLAGNLTCWILPKLDDNNASDMSSSSSDSSYSSSDTDDDTNRESRSTAQNHKEARPFALEAQWKLAEQSHLLPKLNHSALVLAFRKSNSQSTSGEDARDRENSKGQVNGTMQHNAIDPPSRFSDGRVVIITSDNSIIELDIWKGGLTDWCKRNPMSVFPLDYRKIRDKAKGAFWDITEGQVSKERLWVYGPTWLWMFDFARDLPMHEESDGLSGHEMSLVKRRRQSSHDQSVLNRVQPGTGAGSTIRDEDLHLGTTSGMWKGSGTSGATTKFIATAAEVEATPNSESDADGPDNESTKLMAKYRRTDHHERENGLHNEPTVNGDDVMNGEAESMNLADHPHSLNRPHYWHTYKYRPVLGMASLGHTETLDSSDHPPDLEVIIVERPAWDVATTPKYAGK